MKLEVLMAARKMWPVVQRCHMSGQTVISVLFFETPNFGGAKTHPVPPLMTCLGLSDVVF